MGSQNLRILPFARFQAIRARSAARFLPALRSAARLVRSTAARTSLFDLAPELRMDKGRELQRLACQANSS